jgi:hypothetical protein
VWIKWFLDIIGCVPELWSCNKMSFAKSKDKPNYVAWDAHWWKSNQRTTKFYILIIHKAKVGRWLWREERWWWNEIEEHVHQHPADVRDSKTKPDIKTAPHWFYQKLE